MISFACQQCGKPFTVSDDLAGKTGRCKQCGSVMRIPARQAEPIRAETPRVLAEVAVPPVAVPAQNVQVVVNQQERKSANGLGVAGVVLGAIALSGAWIPFLGLLAIPAILLGGILSAVGLLVANSSKRTGVGWPLSGLGLNAAALLILVAINAFFFSAAAKAAKDVKDQVDRQDAVLRAGMPPRRKVPAPAPVPAADPGQGPGPPPTVQP